MNSPGRSWRLRPWSDADAAPVAALPRRVYAGDPLALDTQDVHGPANDPDRAHARTFVAEHDAAILGAGTIWESSFAPARWRVSLQVHPDHRLIGIGSALLARLTSISTARDARPIQVGVRADEAAMLRFLARHGFRHLMRTHLGTINLAAVSQDSWVPLIAADHASDVAGYRIQPLSDFAPHPSLVNDLAALHAAIYRHTHAWSPPAPLDTAQARHVFMGDDLIPEALFVALAGDEPAGVGSLRHGLTPGDIDLGWIGVAPRHLSAAPILVAALVNRCVHYARDHHWQIRYEIDESDLTLWKIIGSLPVVSDPDWLNLERS